MQPSTSTRRGVLGSGVAVLAGAVAGCSARNPPPSLSLALFNHTTVPYTVELTIFDVGGDGTRSEARVYDASVDVPPNDGTATREAVADARQYVLRYSAYRENNRLTDQSHIHYIPTGGDDTVALDVNPNGRVSYRG